MKPPSYHRRVIDIDIHRFLKTRASDFADQTASNYRHYISMFYWYCVDNQIDPAAADEVTVQEWFETKPKWANATKVIAAAAVRSFYGWKYGESHPITQVRVRRRETPPQRTLTEEEVVQILSSIDQNTHIGIRNLAIITLMIDTGLRASEVCNIQLTRMDMKKNSIQVLIKGQRWGEAVFFDYTKHCLARWLAIRPFVAEPVSEHLFVSVGGKNPGTKMTRYGLRTTLERICRRAGVENVSPHVMRRTFATLATENGAPTRLVQLAGRWKDIRMVETYTKALQPEKIKPYSVVNHIMGLAEGEP